MKNIIDKYSEYENVAVYTKKQVEQEDVDKPVVGKVSWMKIELEDFDIDVVEFVDNHLEGDYEELNKLIDLVRKGKIQSILVWDFKEITLEMIDKLIDASIKNIVYLNGFLTTIKI